jgi:hypothetical protein
MSFETNVPPQSVHVACGWLETPAGAIVCARRTGGAARVCIGTDDGSSSCLEFSLRKVSDYMGTYAGLDTPSDTVWRDLCASVQGGTARQEGGRLIFPVSGASEEYHAPADADADASSRPVPAEDLLLALRAILPAPPVRTVPAEEGVHEKPPPPPLALRRDAFGRLVRRTHKLSLGKSSH